MVATPKAVGQKAGLDFRPKTAAYTVTSNVTTGAAGSAINLSVTATSPGHLLLTGSVPAGHAPVVHTFQIQDPPAFARTAFIQALRRAGVTVSATVTGPNPSTLLPAKGSYKPANQVAVFVSPKLVGVRQAHHEGEPEPRREPVRLPARGPRPRNRLPGGLSVEQQFLDKTAKVDTRSSC